MTAPLALPTEADARALTNRIKVAVEGAWLLIQEAYTSRAWAALGYATWDDYCTAEFGTTRLRLPREERQEVVASLRDAGLSIRAIASATRTSVNTVQSDLQVYQTETPGTQRVVGTDGRVYAQSPRPAPAPEPDLLAGDDWIQPAPEPEIIDAELVDEPAPTRTAFDDFTDDERALHQRLANAETVVVSMRTHQRLIAWADSRGLYMRIDRRTPWGNPFEMPDDGDRDTVIRNYERHYLPYKPSLLNRLHELKGKALGCWCAPEPCHGDVLKNGADEL